MFGQEVLTPLTYNHLLFKQTLNQSLTPRSSSDSSNYVIGYETLDLPIIDEFSTNKQRPQYNQLPSPLSEYYLIGKCADILKYKNGWYKFSKSPSKEYFYLGSNPPYYIDSVLLTSPTLFSVLDSPDCNTLSPETFYAPTRMKRFSATGQQIWDSLVYDTIIYSAHLKNYFLKGYLWTDRHAYINTHLPYMPPSKGVATLDGLNEYGKGYNAEGIKNDIADYLTSAPINLNGLNGNDSVYLSFLLQPQGLGDNPDVIDSIVVEFRDDRGRWNTVWSRKGGKQVPLDSLKFSFHSVHIKDQIVPSDPNFFYNEFQFRFKNSATISGINDFWHIDFVRLDRNRTYQDTSLTDENFVYELPSVLKYHTLLPTQQYRGNIDLEDTIFGINRNIYPTNSFPFSGHRFICYNENTGIVYGSSSMELPHAAAPLVFHPLEIKNKLNFPTIVSDSTYVVSKIFVSNPDNYIPNDTATIRQFFFNEMAYDDGSAEWSYGTGGLGTKKLAYRFFIPNKDTLAAIKLMYTNTRGSVENLLFDITVWKTIGLNGKQEQILKTLTKIKPQYIDSLNNFVTYGLDIPLEVQDTIYVGWVQSDERNLQVGYDANSTKGYDNIFLMLNNVWSKANVPLKGSPMIRIILDGERKFPTNEVVNAERKLDHQKITFYPNPASQVVTIQIGEWRDVEISIYDMIGKLVLQQPLREGQLDISNLNQGLYYMKFTAEGQWIQTDKLQVIK
jgi:hypothetical protein